METLTIFAPATISNVGPGFDLLGFAINEPGDTIEISLKQGGSHEIINNTDINIPLEPSANVATVAIDALLSHLDLSVRFTVKFTSKIPPGSGIGSSGASSAAAVFGANKLLGEPLKLRELVPFAMKGEALVSGSAHADNVAPALLGGFTLIRSYDPLEMISIDGPDKLYCTVIHPDIRIATEDSRRILKEKIPMKAAIQQCGNLAGLVTGLIRGDFRLIGDSLHDVIAEPERAFLIPGYREVKEAALKAGALGANISGSGPSIFALSNRKETAGKIAAGMKKVLLDLEINASVFVSTVNKTGACII